MDSSIETEFIHRCLEDSSVSHLASRQQSSASSSRIVLGFRGLCARCAHRSVVAAIVRHSQRAKPLAITNKMTFFHFFNCAALTFGPHAVYYKASPLSEYDTLGTCIKAAVVYLFTTLVKLVCLATFLQVSDHDAFDLPQEILKGLIGFLDVAGLYYALTQVTHRSISQNHKFQAVALGWAFADAVLHKLAPLWVGARGLDFTWEYLLQGVDSNANLVFTVSLVALGSLMWLRKNKPPVLVPFIYASAILVAVMPSITSYLRKGLAWEFSTVVSFELFASLVMAFVTWRLFVACQRPVSSS